MLTKEEELLRASKKGYVEKVTILVDEEGVDVDSEDEVSVCVLCLLILVLFGIVWNHSSHLVFLLWPLGGGTGAIRSRSEPVDQELCK